MQLKSCVVGIDFGTTSLSAVVIEIKTKQIIKVFSYDTNAYLPFADSMKKEQSIEVLSNLFFKILAEIEAIPEIKITAYGFTGQMHGIVGLNEKGEAITNLVTWQDKSGDIALPDGIKLLEKIKQLTHIDTIANGYGIVTLYKWIHYDGRTDIKSFCTVADYFARLLTKTDKIVMDSTMAHSIGLFDIYSNTWQVEAIKNLGLDNIHLPEIVSNSYIVGYTDGKMSNIPVICALGDNQASFWGSVVNEKEQSILLNIGTGTQLSFIIRKDEVPIFEKYINGNETQLRPFDNNSYLVATSFVNGGSAYKALFNFFKEIGTSLFNLNDIDDAKLWKNMESVGSNALAQVDCLCISPLLEEERSSIKQKGSITNMTTSNLDSGHLVFGLLTGLANHYKTGYFPELKDRVKYIYGSGNGLKRNMLSAKIIENTFGHPLHLVSYDEEAAVGVALNAMIVSEVIKDNI